MPTFSTSSTTFPGSTHLQVAAPCQDSATSFIHPNAAIAIVSDGCSSAGKTHLGSSLLIQLTSTWLQQQPLSSTDEIKNIPNTLIPHLFSSIKTVSPSLGLQLKDWMATLLILIQPNPQPTTTEPTENPAVNTLPPAYLFAWGDGAIQLASNTPTPAKTTITLHSVQNAPPYLAYNIPSTPTPCEPISLSFSISPATSSTPADTPLLLSTEPIAYTGTLLTIDSSTLAWLTLSSDGLAPLLISEPNTLPLPWTGSGQFTEREIAYLWRSNWRKNPTAHPHDDCAIATIRIHN